MERQHRTWPPWTNHPIYDNEKQHAQQEMGALLFYTRTMNNTLLRALNTIARKKYAHQVNKQMGQESVILYGDTSKCNNKIFCIGYEIENIK